MEFDDSIVRFNILNAMKHPVEEHSVFHIDIIDDLVEEVHNNLNEEFPELCGMDGSMDCFFCYQCNGVELCSQCAKMDTFLMGDELESPNAFDEIHATDVINPIQPLFPLQSSRQSWS